MKMEDSTGQMIEVLPIGTRIRHYQHSELTGWIKRYEYHQLGKVSPMCYNIGWDDDSLASRLLGWMFIYGTPETVIEAEPNPTK